jgi:hypothetical protein
VNWIKTAQNKIQFLAVPVLYMLGRGEITGFNYSLCNVGSCKERDVDTKLHRLQCRTIREIFLGKVHKETLLKLYEVRQYQLRYVDQKAMH